MNKKIRKCWSCGKRTKYVIKAMQAWHCIECYCKFTYQDGCKLCQKKGKMCFGHKMQIYKKYGPARKKNKRS